MGRVGGEFRVVLGGRAMARQRGRVGQRVRWKRQG